MFCRKCGKENKDDASFCIHCGQAIAKAETTAPQQTSKGKFWKRFGIGCGIVAGVLIIIGVLAAIFGSQNGTENNQNGTENNQNGTPTDGLVTKAASEMVLTLDDFQEAGWTLSKNEDITALKTGSESAHRVYFISQSLMTGVGVGVAVYPSIQSARDAYSSLIPTNVSIEHPSIGDECFLYLPNWYTEETVFRDKNVIVWVVASRYESESYARKVEAKIP
ncbi:MAG: zinc-ribbon domain-containing protein [Methanothrix sp.]|nr:zinc-ribbon domain-containing protein [Methanothrix sp.]